MTLVSKVRNVSTLFKTKRGVIVFVINLFGEIYPKFCLPSNKFHFKLVKFGKKKTLISGAMPQSKEKKRKEKLKENKT